MWGGGGGGEWEGGRAYGLSTWAGEYDLTQDLCKLSGLVWFM